MRVYHMRLARDLLTERTCMASSFVTGSMPLSSAARLPQMHKQYYDAIMHACERHEDERCVIIISDILP
jgi:hypothetical protein